MPEHSTRYSQIAAYYLERINGRRLREGDKMPTEAEIGRLFNVSRITVRHAMDELAKSGHIVRMQGKGSYVSTKKTDMQLNRLCGFSEEMRKKGMVPSATLRESAQMPCERVAAERLQIEPGTPIHRLERLRYADGVPMAIEQVHIPFYLCPGLTDHDLSGSLYRILAEQYHLTPHCATQDIGAGTVSRAMAEALLIKPLSPVLMIERVCYLANGTPLEYVLSVYRGDRYTFRVNMQRGTWDDDYAAARRGGEG